jgi:hypothetical protein
MQIGLRQGLVNAALIGKAKAETISASNAGARSDASLRPSFRCSRRSMQFHLGVEHTILFLSLDIEVS